MTCEELLFRGQMGRC